MALFTDDLVSSVDDLTAYEADLKELATSEGVDLAGKLRLAQTEVAAQLEASSRRPGNVFWAKGGGWGSTGSDVALPRFDLHQVVVTRPLKLWHTFHSLELAYRDAHGRKVEDKFLPKWREYTGLSKWAADLLFQTGVGLVTQPIPQAKAPELDFEAATIEAMSLFVRITWARGEDEGAGSPQRAIRAPLNQALRVTPGPAPEGVTGWNVYLGRKKGEALKQNATPIAVGESWTMPESGFASGAELGDGQAAEVFRTAPRFLFRG